MKTRSFHRASSSSQTRFTGLCSEECRFDLLWFSFRIMQASVWLHCSFVTLNSYIKSPQKFVLCYLSVACSQFLACFTVQFSRCRSSDLFQDQIETLRICKMLQSKLGGDKRDRTADLLNAIQALSQLSYTPISNYKLLVGPSGLEPPTSRLSVVRSSQLSYGPVSTH